MEPRTSNSEPEPEPIEPGTRNAEPGTRSFRGWTKPGVVPPGEISPPDIPADQTLDALSGRFRIFQLKGGHRFSTDDVLTAWYGTTWVPSARAALDLGSGIGSVGMIAAWRLPGARFVAIEAQPESVALARRSAIYNGLAGRYDIRQSDFRTPEAFASGERFDLILGSPPYFPRGSGLQGDHPQKIACRFELRGDVGDYARVAAERLAGGGVFALVFPESQRERVERAASDARLVIVRRRPVAFRAGEPPLIGLYLLMRGSDLPESMRAQTWVEPTLTIRCADGTVHPEYSAVKLSIGFPP
ncbi:MAG TPA: methyltransferase [Vicinamibacterales bacterium]|nr:methyltransferase [Vicinamibacterales bacterium]